MGENWHYVFNLGLSPDHLLSAPSFFTRLFVLIGNLMGVVLPPKKIYIFHHRAHSENQTDDLLQEIPALAPTS